MYLLALHRKRLLAPCVGRLKAQGWKMIYQVTTDQNKAEVATLIADKEDFKKKKLPGRNRPLHNDAGINSQDLTVPNSDAPDGRVPDMVRQKLIEAKEEIDKSTIIFRDIIISFSAIDRRRQKISKAWEDLNNTLAWPS